MELTRAVFKTLKDCARLKPGESVLILADTLADYEIVTKFGEVAHALGAEVSVMVYEAREEVDIEPPRPVAAALSNADLVVDLVTKYIIHTDSYLRARKNGVRILCGTGITQDMLIRMVGQVDYSIILESAKRVKDMFDTSRRCEIRTKEEHLLTMKLGDRPVLIRDGVLEGAGDLDYIPGAQVSLAPLEETIEGSIVVNGTIYPPIGRLNKNIILRFKEGKLINIEGGSEADIFRRWLKSFNDPKMYYVAHISIGLNPKARISGNILEDERIAGAFVLGLGSQMEYFKGNIGKASAHSDSVVLGANVLLDGKYLVRDGRLES